MTIFDYRMLGFLNNRPFREIGVLEPKFKNRKSQIKIDLVPGAISVVPEVGDDVAVIERPADHRAVLRGKPLALAAPRRLFPKLSPMRRAACSQRIFSR